MAKNYVITVIGGGGSGVGMVNGTVSSAEPSLSRINGSGASGEATVNTTGMTYKNLVQFDVLKNSAVAIAKTAVNVSFTEFNDHIGARKFGNAQQFARVGAAFAIGGPIAGGIAATVTVASANISNNADNRKANRESEYIRDRFGISTTSGGR